MREGGGMRDAIGYIRVSTTKQGRSGLGLEDQAAALAKFAEAEGFHLTQTSPPDQRHEFGLRDPPISPYLPKKFIGLAVEPNLAKSLQQRATWMYFSS
jgi:hypothetical protein